MKKRAWCTRRSTRRIRYRMYSLYQIMELLDVSYYRSLGMSIEQIQQLYESSNEEQLMELLDKKRQETEHRIRYEQQLLKRIEHVGRMAARIRERDGEIGIEVFPESYVLFEQQENSLERYLEQVSGMDYDHYIFCQMVRELMIDTEEKGCSQTPVRTMLLLDRRGGGRAERADRKPKMCSGKAGVVQCGPSGKRRRKAAGSVRHVLLCQGA